MHQASTKFLMPPMLLCIKNSHKQGDDALKAIMIHAQHRNKKPHADSCGSVYREAYAPTMCSGSCTSLEAGPVSS
jgi:hypothetical protein